MPNKRPNLLKAMLGPPVPDPRPMASRPAVMRAPTKTERVNNMLRYLYDQAAEQPLGRVADLFGVTDLRGMASPSPLSPLLGDVPLGAPGKAIRAYHGSPHDFEKFSMAKVGTGEGAQAYGHGLYFADKPQTAAAYRDRLSGTSGITPGASQGRGKLMVGDVAPPEGIAGHKALDTAQDIQGLLYYKQNGYQDMVDVVQKNIEQRIKWWKESKPSTGIADEDMRQLVNYYEQHVRTATPAMIKARPPGRMYEVAIDADQDTLLDWDAPLSQQGEKVRQAVSKSGVTTGYEIVDRTTASGRPNFVIKVNGQTVGASNTLEMAHENARHLLDPAGADVYHKLVAGGEPSVSFQNVMNPPSASAKLRDAGIPGIKYFDQGSRSAGQGTRNYVIFDDSIISILKKYGVALPVIEGLRRQAAANGGQIDRAKLDAAVQ